MPLLTWYSLHVLFLDEHLPSTQEDLILSLIGIRNTNSHRYFFSHPEVLIPISWTAVQHGRSPIRSQSVQHLGSKNEPCVTTTRRQNTRTYSTYSAGATVLNSAAGNCGGIAVQPHPGQRDYASEMHTSVAPD